MIQLSSSLLDACVLAVTSKGDTYGYLLTQAIRNIIGVSESTLYPVLRRLQAEQMLTTYDSPHNGRNRRYYQITPRGQQQLAFLREDWNQYKAAIDYLLDPATPVVTDEKKETLAGETVVSEAVSEATANEAAVSETSSNETGASETGINEAGATETSVDETTTHPPVLEGEQS